MNVRRLQHFVGREQLVKALDIDESVKVGARAHACASGASPQRAAVPHLRAQGNRLRRSVPLARGSHPVTPCVRRMSQPAALGAPSPLNCTCCDIVSCDFVRLAIPSRPEK
jgi:hypothetical protein